MRTQTFRGHLVARIPLVCVAVLWACSSSTGGPIGQNPPPSPPPAPPPPPGSNTTIPYPIDRGDDGAGAPGTYKGLALRLVDNGAPVVTPVDGIIGLVCVGMSNGFRECNDYQMRVETEFADAINPAVRVVNCAVGGNAIEKWIDPGSDAELWDRCVNDVLPAAGVRPDQVRVLWHKAADQFTTLPGNIAKPAYPSPESDYFAFLANLSTFAGRVHEKFPAVQAVYTSSRSYGGYAIDAPGRGEPLSYEEGHALNTWFASHGAVDGVWYGWGPYLWAGACTGGVPNGSGVCYDRADYVDDGVHPSASGEEKVSNMLHTRFLEESWYRRP